MPHTLSPGYRHGLKNILKSLLHRAGYSLVRDDLNWQSPSGSDHILKQVIGDPATPPLIFDIGANNGRTTTRFKRLFPSASIYAFEPVDTTFSELARNTGHLTDVRSYLLAIGSDEGVSRIYLRENNEWNSLVPQINDYLREQNRPFVEVPRTTIDRFIETNSITHIDILKIDTEGYEIEVLKGARSAFDAGLIGAVYLEVGFDRTQLQHSFYLDVLETMDRLGFRFRGFFELSFENGARLDFANALFTRNT